MSDCKLNDLYRNPIQHHAPQKLHLFLFIHATLYINMTVKGVEIDFFFLVRSIIIIILKLIHSRVEKKRFPMSGCSRSVSLSISRNSQWETDGLSNRGTYELTEAPSHGPHAAGDGPARRDVALWGSSKQHREGQPLPHARRQICFLLCVFFI